MESQFCCFVDCWRFGFLLAWIAGEMVSQLDGSMISGCWIAGDMIHSWLDPCFLVLWIARDLVS